MENVYLLSLQIVAELPRGDNVPLVPHRQRLDGEARLLRPVIEHTLGWTGNHTVIATRMQVLREIQYLLLSAAPRQMRIELDDLHARSSSRPGRRHNAKFQPRLEAEAQQTLFAVACTPFSRCTDSL
jgi:hypothetical protein